MKSASKISDIVSVVVFSMLSVFLALWNNPEANNAVSKEKAKVLAVDNSHINKLGVVHHGAQLLEVEILSGSFAGKKFRAENNLRANMDLDKFFNVGNEIIVAITQNAVAEKTQLIAQDFYRANYAFWLFALFALLLVCFAGWTGLKALLSFVFAGIFIWKVVVTLCLSGANAIVVCFCAVIALCFAIIFLVGGFSRKAVVAFLGATLGVSASCIMAIFFTRLFHINGATMPFSQALFYSGYEFLSLADLFIGGIFLSSSGAVMDLAMDVAAGQEEVFLNNRSISKTSLAISGWKIGRSVVGTMTTTLLLAYSGGYLTLIMAFTAERVCFLDFISNPYVCTEMVKTIIGSFGLVLVAPFTALVGGMIIPRKN